MIMYNPTKILEALEMECTLAMPIAPEDAIITAKPMFKKRKMPWTNLALSGLTPEEEDVVVVDVPYEACCCDGASFTLFVCLFVYSKAKYTKGQST